MLLSTADRPKVILKCSGDSLIMLPNTAYPLKTASITNRICHNKVLPLVDIIEIVSFEYTQMSVYYIHCVVY